MARDTTMDNNKCCQSRGSIAWLNSGLTGGLTDGGAGWPVGSLTPWNATHRACLSCMNVCAATVRAKLQMNSEPSDTIDNTSTTTLVFDALNPNLIFIAHNGDNIHRNNMYMTRLAIKNRIDIGTSPPATSGRRRDGLSPSRLCSNEAAIFVFENESLTCD